MTKIYVGFSKAGYSSMVAVFLDADAFNLCLPALQDWADISGHHLDVSIVTEIELGDEE
jgi:hypothetical protein